MIRSISPVLSPPATMDISASPPPAIDPSLSPAPAADASSDVDPSRVLSPKLMVADRSKKLLLTPPPPVRLPASSSLEKSETSGSTPPGGWTPSEPRPAEVRLRRGDASLGSIRLASAEPVFSSWGELALTSSETSLSTSLMPQDPPKLPPPLPPCPMIQILGFRAHSAPWGLGSQGLRVWCFRVCSGDVCRKRSATSSGGEIDRSSIHAE